MWISWVKFGNVAIFQNRRTYSLILNDWLEAYCWRAYFDLKRRNRQFSQIEVWQRRNSQKFSVLPKITMWNYLGSWNWAKWKVLFENPTFCCVSKWQVKIQTIFAVVAKLPRSRENESFKDYFFFFFCINSLITPNFRRKRNIYIQTTNFEP